MSSCFLLLLLDIYFGGMLTPVAVDLGLSPGSHPKSHLLGDVARLILSHGVPSPTWMQWGPPEDGV